MWPASLYGNMHTVMLSSREKIQHIVTEQNRTEGERRTEDMEQIIESKIINKGKHEITIKKTHTHKKKRARGKVARWAATSVPGHGTGGTNQLQR